MATSIMDIQLNIEQRDFLHFTLSQGLCKDGIEERFVERVLKDDIYHSLFDSSTLNDIGTRVQARYISRIAGKSNRVKALDKYYSESSLSVTVDGSITNMEVGRIFSPFVDIVYPHEGIIKQYDVDEVIDRLKTGIWKKY